MISLFKTDSLEFTPLHAVSCAISLAIRCADGMLEEKNLLHKVRNVSIRDSAHPFIKTSVVPHRFRYENPAPDSAGSPVFY